MQYHTRLKLAILRSFLRQFPSMYIISFGNSRYRSIIIIIINILALGSVILHYYDYYYYYYCYYCYYYHYTTTITIYYLFIGRSFFFIVYIVSSHGYLPVVQRCLVLRPISEMKLFRREPLVSTFHYCGVGSFARTLTFARR